MEFKSTLEDGREVSVLAEGDGHDVYVAAVFDAKTDEEIESISDDDESRLWVEAYHQIDHAENLRDQERKGSMPMGKPLDDRQVDIMLTVLRRRFEEFYTQKKNTLSRMSPKEAARACFFHGVREYLRTHNKELASIKNDMDDLMSLFDKLR